MSGCPVDARRRARELQPRNCGWRLGSLSQNMMRQTSGFSPTATTTFAMHTRRRAAQDQDPAPSVDPAPDQQDTAAAVKKREKQEENARKKEEMTKKKDEAARKRKETIARKKEEAAKRAAETQLDQELLEVAHDDAVAKEAARVAAAKLRESLYGLWLKTTIDSHAAPTTGRAAKDQAAKKTTGERDIRVQRRYTDLLFS